MLFARFPLLHASYHYNECWNPVTRLVIYLAAIDVCCRSTLFSSWFHLLGQEMKQYEKFSSNNNAFKKCYQGLFETVIAKNEKKKLQEEQNRKKEMISRKSLFISFSVQFFVESFLFFSSFSFRIVLASVCMSKLFSVISNRMCYGSNIKRNMVDERRAICVFIGS